MDVRELPTGEFQRHPWEAARARFFCDVLRNWAGISGRAITALDVGAGDGYFAATLATEVAEGSAITCVDTSYTGTPAAVGSPGPPRATLTFTRVVPEATVDLLLLLDVLEHVRDDLGLLSDLVCRVLRPGACALISVPAGPRLFTQHDVVLGHYRRYRAQRLRELVRDAGLQMVAHGGLFHGLLALRGFQKLLELARGRFSEPAVTPGNPGSGPVETKAGSWDAGPALTSFVGAGLRLENLLSLGLARAGLTLPGLSVWALARRP
jgi:SAM-dependent methyltransferase